MSEHNHIIDKCTFELISAYLDGEVTPQEREQVQLLLTQDLQARRLYKRLQNLRQQIHDLPNPELEFSAQSLSHRVFAKIDRQKRARKRWLWGGGAIAALMVAAVGSIFSDSNGLVWQFAGEREAESLILALNEPLVDLNPSTATEDAAAESLRIPLNHSLIEIPESQ